jgi:hypothetical protein
MDPITQQTVLAAAGSAAAGAGLYVEDVFSTDLWPGTASAKKITTGIDLATEGGLVWIKNRTGGNPPTIRDTERGANKGLDTNSNSAEYTSNFAVTAFTSSGFTLGADATVNGSSFDFVGWSFRKAPGFFDVQTWTGNGAARTIAHNLGSVPGMIIVKSVGFSENWKVWHRNLPNTATDFLNLNESGAKESSSTIWNNTAPTSTHFSLGNNLAVNGGGNSDYTYVAYIFAHDDQSFGTSSNEAIIKCGSFTGANHTESLGFEPQWLLVKKTNTSTNANWIIVDNMRGFFPKGTDSIDLHPNTADDEHVSPFHITSNGFYYSSSSATYAYMAIRRPHKPPEAGTDVFLPAAVAGNSDITTGFPVDVAFQLRRTSGSKALVTRLTGKNSLETRNTGAETTNANAWYESNTKLLNTGLFSADSAFHLFKRAPGFMDVVTYTAGYGTPTVFSHNLGVEPELMINKCRSNAFNWWTYVRHLGADKTIRLDTNDAEISATVFGNTHPTATQMTFGSGLVSENGRTFVVYLFATLAGISKVGNYTGTGNAINVDCGFSAGARYILIKRTDSSGDWFVYDTARGIVSGNDPYLLVNDSAGEVTNTDYIDPLNSGFTVTSSAPTGLNASGGTYIFLAIA